MFVHFLKRGTTFVTSYLLPCTQKSSRMGYSLVLKKRNRSMECQFFILCVASIEVHTKMTMAELLPKGVPFALKHVSQKQIQQK